MWLVGKKKIKGCSLMGGKIEGLNRLKFIWFDQSLQTKSFEKKKKKSVNW